MLPFVNCHAHIFNSSCAPDYYLRMVLPKVLDPFANTIKAFLDKKMTRAFMVGLIKVATLFDKNKRKAFERYLSFITVGSSASQRDIFRSLLDNYKNIQNPRVVALTLNMDHMGHFASNHASINSQLTEMKELKKEYPDNIFPFISIDPRHLGGRELLTWVQRYINDDKFFCGIKMYPAKGFFPFDPRLDEVYAWAEQENIPIMTHCTRSGSFFIDTIDRSAVVAQPLSLNNNPKFMHPIYDRIGKVLADKGIHKKNFVWCNLFTHPEHYLPVLDKYPDLKLCFAHFGGSNEVIFKTPADYPEYLGPNWFTLIQELIQNPEYKNIYTDISYTLYNPDSLNAILKWYDQASPEKKLRVLFGTDYYMTEQEKSEKDLLANAMETLGPVRIEQIARINPHAYLSSNYYN